MSILANDNYSTISYCLYGKPCVLVLLYSVWAKCFLFWKVSVRYRLLPGKFNIWRPLGWWWLNVLLDGGGWLWLLLVVRKLSMLLLGKRSGLEWLFKLLNVQLRIQTIQFIWVKLYWNLAQINNTIYFPKSVMFCNWRITRPESEVFSLDFLMNYCQAPG